MVTPALPSFLPLCFNAFCIFIELSLSFPTCPLDAIGVHRSPVPVTWPSLLPAHLIPSLGHLSLINPKCIYIPPPFPLSFSWLSMWLTAVGVQPFLPVPCSRSSSRKLMCYLLPVFRPAACLWPASLPQVFGFVCLVGLPSMDTQSVQYFKKDTMK